MANLYNDSSIFIQQSGSSTGNFQNLTVKNLIAENAAIDNLNVDATAVFNSVDTNNLTMNFPLGALLFSNSGPIDGLQIGNQNDVLISNGIPEWTNSLTLQDLTTNTLKIPTTQNGDLIVFDNANNAQRLAVGSSGQFLISDGVNPTWNDIPNPFIVGNLIVQQTLTLSYINKTIITDGTGVVCSENIRYTSGSAIINGTPSTFYANVSWAFTQFAWYSIKVQLESANSYIGEIKVMATTIGTVNTIKTFFCDFTYNHSSPTGVYGIGLENFVGSASITYSIRVERIPQPLII